MPHFSQTMVEETVQEGKDNSRIDAAHENGHTGNATKTVSPGIGPDAEKKNFLDVTALIRSVQRAEGLSDCFRKGVSDCDQPDCKWRSFCFEDTRSNISHR